MRCLLWKVERRRVGVGGWLAAHRFFPELPARCGKRNGGYCLCSAASHASLTTTTCSCPPVGEQVPTRYSERNGGYCRVKAEVQPRRGDNTEMATIELV